MEKDKNTEQSPDYVYGPHAVAFLDLLGHKEKLAAIEGLINRTAPNAADIEKVRLTLKATVGAIWSFRKSFSESFIKLVNQPPQVTVPSKYGEHFQQLRTYSKINFQSFSDSTIVWTQVAEKTEFDYARTLNSIHGILGVIAMLYPLYLSQGVPFRGGIDIEGGISIVPNGSEIYGPALNRAYTLECKLANYPRVLIGAGITDLLDHVSQMHFQDEIIQSHCNSIIGKCHNWLTTDDDGRLMVHFLGPQARALSLTMGQNYMSDIFYPMEEFILESQRKFESDVKLKEKYFLLKNYFDKYAGLWR